MNGGLSPRARIAVLLAAMAGLLFDGVELGLMPIASLSVSKSLLGQAYTPAEGGAWFARFTAALMLGAAVGGIYLGNLGDKVGRTRALGISILFYSIAAGLGALVQTQTQMLILRFVVGLGVGGVWPNAVALAAECWPDKSRPVIAGLMGAALNAGILLLSQLARLWPITPDSWRWFFGLAAAPALLGILILVWLPESPLWKPATKTTDAKPAAPLSLLLRPPLRRILLTGILIGSVPMVGAWAASKWMIPWADAVAGTAHQGYKAAVQGSWAVGAVLGSFLGAQIAGFLGRRRAYLLFSIGSTALTFAMFAGTAPLRPGFLVVVFAQGLVATLFFGWLPLYLPELFPTSVRATGTGIAYNTGRFATALGVFAAGALFTALGGSYPQVGMVCSLIYALGIAAIALAPETSKRSITTPSPSSETSG